MNGAIKMLTYHPIHDPSHCIFRLLCLMNDIKKEEVSWEQLKILDFYVLFPHFISDMRMPKELSGYRKMLKNISKPYENLPATSRLMFELGKIQERTINSMVAKGLVEKDVFLSGHIKVRFPMIPKKIITSIEDAKFRKEEWYSFLTNLLVQIPTKGKDGIKDRTGLMEYRYDDV